jgi:monoamine oxidase
MSNRVLKKVNRRRALAVIGAAMVRPAIAASDPRADFDVVIVGAGAAGVAAARRVAAAGLTYVVFEANDRWGGRCHTDTRTFGIPYDRGARWLYEPDSNPLGNLATKFGMRLDSGFVPQRLRVGVRDGHLSELEQLLSGLLRCRRAIAEMAKGPVDVSCAEALPKDLVDWRPTIEFMLGPHMCGRELREVSSRDFANLSERDSRVQCPQGIGTLIGKLAVGSPIQFYSPVTAIEWGGPRIKVEVRGATLTANAIVITASTGVLSSGKINFRPALPVRYLEAINKLQPGHLDNVAIQFKGNPLGLKDNELVQQKVASQRTAVLLANQFGSSLCTVELSGASGRDLANEGDAAMIAFAQQWIADLLGSDAKRSVLRASASRWSKEPFILGAMSVAPPGEQSTRATLSAPLNDRLWFAGEATHQTSWGTVEGAWESGERAANAVVERLHRKA